MAMVLKKGGHVSRPHSFPRPLSTGRKLVEAKRKILSPRKTDFRFAESVLIEAPRTARKKKHPFLFQKKFHPRQIRNARSVFSFGVAGVLASAWGFNADDLVSLNHAPRACHTLPILKIGSFVVPEVGLEHYMFSIQVGYFHSLRSENISAWLQARVALLKQKLRLTTSSHTRLCRRWDLNPHELLRTILSRVRIPIPPLRQYIH